MRNVVLLSVVLISLFACSGNRLEVEGCVVGYPQGTFCLIDLNGDTVMQAQVEQGRFCVRKEFVPGMYWFALGAYREQKYIAGGKVKIEGIVSEKYPLSCAVRTTGLEEDDRLGEICRQINSDCFQEWSNARKAETDSVRFRENDYDAYALRLSERRSVHAVPYVQKENCPHFAAALAYQNCGKYYESVKLLYDALTEEGKASAGGQQIKKLMDLKQASANGNKAPDFKVVNETGKTVRLSDFRGKVVVLDVWGSWCAPCRKEIPRMKKIYERFACPELVFMSVAMDDKKEAWLEASAKENFPWLNLWEPDGFKLSKLRAAYSFSTIPFILVADREGRVVGKGLIRDQLSACLEKLLKN